MVNQYKHPRDESYKKSVNLAHCRGELHLSIALLALLTAGFLEQ